MQTSSRIGILHRGWIVAESRALRYLASIAARRSRLPAHLLTGMAGEREAIFYLRREGYIVVARRWRSARQRGDLDLIAWYNGTLCFLEIKTRSRRDAIPAEAAVDHDKQQTLRSLARAYMRRLPASSQQAPARFDILSVYMDSRINMDSRANSSSHSDVVPSGQNPVTSTTPTAATAEPDFVLYQGAFPWK
jgi:putative endonuclease